MKINFKISRINNRDIASISGNIAKLYEQGIPFTVIFSLLIELPLSKEYKESIKIIDKIIQNGDTLEQAFKSQKDLFPEHFSSIIAIGEKTGKITEVLKALEFYHNKIISIKKIIINACTYPIILIVAVIFLFIFMTIVLIPSFSDIYVSMNKEIPKMCQIMLDFNKVLRNKPIVVLSYLISAGVLIFYLSITKSVNNIIIKILYKISLVKNLTEYIMILLMGIVIKSGINLSTGLDYCSTMTFMNKDNSRIKEINKDIIMGRTLAEAMQNSKIFSNYTLAHIKLGEETGTLEEKFGLLEKELFDNIITKVNRYAQNLQPIMIVSIGVLILGFIVTFIAPLFNVMDVM